MVFRPEAALVRRIFREYLRQGSLGRLGRWLTERGLARGGRPWSRPALLWILRNPAYRGILKTGRRRARRAHPAIVPEALFARVQRALAARRRNPQRPAGREVTEHGAFQAVADLAAKATPQTPAAARA